MIEHEDMDIVLLKEVNEHLERLNENLTALSISIENNNRSLNEVIGLLRNRL